MIARVTADTSGFAEGMRQAAAIARDSAGDIEAALSALSENGAASLGDLSSVAQRSAQNVNSSLAAMAEAGRGASESIAGALASASEAGGRFFDAWMRGGRNLGLEFAETARSLLSEFARTGLQDLVIGGSRGSLGGAVFGTRGSGGLYGLAAGAFQETALEQALDRAWRGISGTVSEVFSGAFHALAGSFTSLFGNAFSGAAAGAISNSAAATVSEAATAAETTALTANTAAIGVLSAAMAANTIAVEQLVAVTELDAATSLPGFEGGGIVPSAARGMVLGGRASLAILHPREMVLPAPLSEGVQSAITAGRFGESSGGDVHIHIGSIQGGNPTDLRRELERFADRIGDIVRDQHRANRFLKTRY